MTVHVGESRDETLFVRDGAGPFAAAHAKRGIEVTARGCTPVAYLDSLGVLGSDLLLVHGVEVDDRDIDRLRDTGTFVVHCPKSNATLGNATARILDMQDRGVHVSLGTDSLASNDVIDMFEEMRAAIVQQRARTGRAGLTAAKAFRMATIEGAEAMGLDKHLGSLESGKRADFAVVDLGRGTTQPVNDPILAMVESASRSDVKTVFLAGRAACIDHSEILMEMSRIVQKLR